MQTQRAVVAIAELLAEEKRLGRAAFGPRIRVAADSIPPSESLDVAELLSLHHHFQTALAIVDRIAGNPTQSAYEVFRAGVVAYACRDPRRAITLFERVLAARPDDAGVLTELAVARLSQGDLEAARDLLDRAVRKGPNWVPALHESVLIGPVDQRSDALAQLTRIAMDPARLPPNWVVRLWFALGKAYDDLGEWERAWNAYETGARAAFQNRGDVDLAHRRAAATLRSAPLVAEGAPDRIVFIVGMPRSGTTLAEQILLGADGAASIGETPALDHSARIWDQSASHERWRDDALGAFRSNYTAFWPEYESHSASIVIDKTPGNYLWAAPASRAFPGAHFLHCQRSAMETCWSLYTTWFGAGTPWSYHLDAIAKAYVRYHDYMAVLRETLGDRLIDFDHSALLAAPESATKDLFQRARLPWAPTVIETASRSKPVVTPSMTQVRRRIGDVATRRYEPYLPHLGALVDTLQKAGVDIA
jgi:hypothetical protein